MQKLLMTTALVLPLVAGPVFAQEQAPLADEQDQAQQAEPLIEGEEAEGEDPAMAQEADPADPALEDPAMAEDAGAEPAAPPPGAVVTEQGAQELRGDWITGTTVLSPEGETIGSIQDIIIDGEEGRVSAAILSVGGFLGLGAKNIAVDWNELQIDYDGREITLALTREEAENAPEYAFRDQAEAPAPAPVGGEAPAPAEPSQ